MSARDHIDDEVESLRVPPHSIEAEQSVLGGLLIDNSAWDRAGYLLIASNFYRPEHRHIFGAIAALTEDLQPVDVVTVFEWLQRAGKDAECGGLVYLNDLARGVPGGANMRRYVEIVRERAVLRQIIAATSDAVTIAWSSEDDAGGKVDKITSLFGEMQRGQVRKAVRAIGELSLERTAFYEAIENGDVEPGWKTPFPRLTASLGGGLRPGGLYILAARPGVGKSSFAQSLGLHLADSGLPVLFCSMEMPDVEVVDRGFASQGRVSYSAMLTGKMSTDDWSRVVEAQDQFAKRPFYIADQPALTLRDIRAKAKSVKGLKVLILDYLQLCGGSRRDGNRNAEIEEISRGLKTLAKELGIAVVALSQLNRSVETRASKRPILADLRDSGAIEQDADVILFLWPVREIEGEGRRVVGLGIDKNRQGPHRDVGLDFYGDTQRWEESNDDIRPLASTQGKRVGAFE